MSYTATYREAVRGQCGRYNSISDRPRDHEHSVVGEMPGWGGMHDDDMMISVYLRHSIKRYLDRRCVAAEP